MTILNDEASLKKNKYSTWLEDESLTDADNGPFQYNTERCLFLFPYNSFYLYIYILFVKMR